MEEDMGYWAHEGRTIDGPGISNEPVIKSTSDDTHREESNKCQKKTTMIGRCS